jgi:hypothetical protein
MRALFVVSLPVALFTSLFAFFAYAQHEQPDPLGLCTSQNFIIGRYLATDEQVIIQLRASMTQLTDQIANLQKQLEESKGEKK